MSAQALKVRRKIFGREHHDTLDSMAMVGLAYNLRGQWDAAEEIEVQVMETSKKKLGAYHPSTLTSMNNLAFTWKGQGRDAEAVGLMRECVRFQQQILGANHPNFISSLNSLARWEAEQSDTGALAEGMAKGQECLISQKKKKSL